MVFIGVAEARVLMETRIEDARREAERRALLASIPEARPGWLCFHGAWLLKQMGRQLVVLGERLEGRSIPQPSQT